MTFPANLYYSSLIRHISAEIFHGAKFSTAWCNRLKLVVDELFMNSVRYGSTKDKSLIHMTFIFDEESLDFIIEDDGTGENGISVDELRQIIQKNQDDNNPSKTSGRGLSMITQKWTDSMEIEKSEHGGIKISFNKKMETETPSIGSPIEELRRSPQYSTESFGPIEGPIDKKVIEIKLDGEIDHSNISKEATRIHEQLKNVPEGGELVLDFENVTYVNSTFIGNLIAWHSSLEHKGAHIRFKNLSNQIKEVFNVVGVLKLIKTT